MSTQKKSYKYIQEDKDGNKYYPHTMADIVHIDENTTIGDWIADKEANIESAIGVVNTATTNANTQATYAKEQGDYAKVEGDKTANRVTLDGQSQENFNFIANKVVQDGLVKHYKNETASRQETIESVEIKTVIGKYKHFGDGLWGCPIGLRQTESSFEFQVASYKLHFYCSFTESWQNILTLKDNEVYYTEVTAHADCLTVRVNDVVRTLKYTKTPNFNVSKIGILKKIDSTTNNYTGSMLYTIIYNRQLTPQEIQHNFQVLNNSPSLIAMNDYKFASDSEHVTMRNGFNLEEAYTGMAKTMAREFTSTGDAITVNNGVDKSKILMSELTGMTVKSYAGLTTINTALNSTTQSVTLAGNAEFLDKTKAYKIKSQYTSATNAVMTATITFEDATTTTLALGTRTASGVYEVDITANTYTKNYKVTAINLTNTTTDATANCTIYQVSVIDSANGVYVAIPFGFGLKSTQAIISNSSMKYPFYELEILGTAEGLVPTDNTLPTLVTGDVLDLATKTITFANKTTQVLTDRQIKAYDSYKRIISLPFAEDKVTLNEDGSATWIDSSNRISISGGWRFNSVNTFYYVLGGINVKSGNSVLYDRLPTGVKSIYAHTTNREILLCSVDLSVLPDVESVNSAFASTQVEVVYISETPTTTHIPKQLCPTIPISKTNILKAGDAVKASSFTVSVPVDRIAEMQTQIDNMMKVFSTQSNMFLSANYVDDEYRKNQSNENQINKNQINEVMCNV